MKNLIIVILFLLPFTVSAQLLRSYGVVQNGSVDEQLTFLKRALYIIDRIAKKLGIIS